MSWAPEFGGRFGFPPPEKTGLVRFSLQWGVQMLYLFNQTKHPVLTRLISNPQNPFSAPKFWSPVHVGIEPLAPDRHGSSRLLWQLARPDTDASSVHEAFW